MQAPRSGAAAVLLMACALATGCLPASGPRTLEGATMGTHWRVELARARAGEVPALRSAVEQRLAAINSVFSTWDPASELSRLNHDPSTGWVAVSGELFWLLRQAAAMHARSGGAFDISVGPLVQAWGFGPGGRGGTPPDPGTLARARALCGMDKIELRSSPPAVRRRVTGMQLDVSGIVPGYAVDEIVALLQARGQRDVLVELGGEVRGAGQRPGGGAWRVGIERPHPRQRRIATVVELSGAALATSGDYRNFYLHEGRRYAHTIDPRSGAPVAHDLVSVTILAPTALAADALATAVMVLGPRDGAALVAAQGLRAVFIRETGGELSLQQLP